MNDEIAKYIAKQQSELYEERALYKARRIVTVHTPPRAAFTWGWDAAIKYLTMKQETIDK